MKKPATDRQNHAEIPPENPQTEEKTRRAPFEAGKLMLPIFLGLLFLCLFFLIDRSISAWRYRRLPEAGKFRVRCRKNLKLMRILGYVPADGETLEEFRNRALADLSSEAVAFTEAMEQYTYADVRPDADMLALTQVSEERLWDHLKEKSRLLFMLKKVEV